MAGAAFWDFSLRTYRTGGVPDACIALQDDQGVDVNLLLYCCWTGGRAVALDDAAFDRAFAFSRDWSGHVVVPLRSARRWMKASGCADTPIDTEACMALREQVKAIELGAEKLQQLALAALPLPGQDHGNNGHGGGSLEAVAANLRRYFMAIGADISDDTVDRLEVIVRAAFPREKDPAIEAFRKAMLGG